MKRRGIHTLRKSAQETTVSRGHRMRWMKPEPMLYFGKPKEGRFRQDGACRDCDMTVHLTTHPVLNEIDICGQAVAIECSVQKHRR